MDLIAKRKSRLEGLSASELAYLHALNRDAGSMSTAELSERLKLQAQQAGREWTEREELTLSLLAELREEVLSAFGSLDFDFLLICLIYGSFCVQERREAITAAVAAKRQEDIGDEARGSQFGQTRWHKLFAHKLF